MITPEIIERLKLSLVQNEFNVWHWPELATTDRKAYIMDFDKQTCRIHLKSKTHWFQSSFPYETLANDSGIQLIKKVVEKEWSKIIKLNPV